MKSASLRERLCLLKNARLLGCLFELVPDLFREGSRSCAYAIASWGMGLLLRNRTSRFRFCTVAAR